MPEEHAPEPAHAEWFRSVELEIKKDYDRLHQEAIEDPQRAGHGGESTWVGILKQWLPPAYEVVTRKYVIPELGARSPETDIIVLHPSYPVPLRSRAEILAGGVAAAFSVKLTLDAAGIRDGVKRAADLRRGLNIRYGTTLRDEMLAPFPVGVLAHSHVWKAPGSGPAENVTKQLLSLDNELINHPRESLDYLCVADLGMWWTARVPYLLPTPIPDNIGATMAAVQRGEGRALTAIGQTDPNETFTAVASFITHLLVRMSYTDPTLRPLANNLREMGTLGNTTGMTREWDLDAVFSEGIRRQLPAIAVPQGSDYWGSAFF